MNLKHDNAPTAVRTRKLMPRPVQEGDQDFGANVLPIGTHLREFEILDLIGEGGFGIVYLAYDHSLERYVALKEYMPSGLATRTTKMAVSVRSQKKLDTFTAGLKSFINEARMLAQFDSQALVKVHTFWEGNGTAYMVMPYYEGMTLKQALHTRKIVPTEAWIRMLLADLCDAIEILHRAHCLHRDIAPDNILLLKDGRPLLLDFGAARRVIGDLTQCFTAILKPGFAPIEQYADIAGLRQGAWTDIYALAAVVYYLITGKAPPPSVARMVHDELVPAREAGKGRYSEAFLAAVDKSLAVRPEQRFHSIDELRHALGLGEPEPRTVPRGGGDWSTTVARTIPVVNAFSPQGPLPADAPDVPGPTAAAAPRASAIDGTRYTGPAQQAATKADENAGETVHDKAVGGKHGRAIPSPQPEMAAAPEDFSATRIAGDYHAAHAPPHRFEHDAAVPPRRDRQGWLVLALLFAVGIGSGIYVGANRSWDGLSEQAILNDSGKGEVAGVPPAASPAGDLSSGTASPSEAVGTPELPATTEPPQTARLVSEIDQWKMASKLNEASAYENYLREYPQGRYAAIAKLRLQRLQAAATPPSPPEIAMAAPAPAAPPPVAAAPPRTAAAPPATPPAPAAAAKDTRASTGRPEEAAWTTASAIHSVAAYREYLRKYPKGGYAALARDRLATMQAGAVTPSLPSAQNAGTPQSPSPENLVAGKSPEASPAAPGAVSPAAPAAMPPTAAAAERASTAEQAPPVASSSGTASAPAQEVVTPAPQAALKPQESAPAEPIAGSSKSALRFEDQTITGDYSIDRRSGLVSGKVKISWSNGNLFEGTLVQGSKEGKGKFTWNSGQRYSGDWARDMPNGKGTFNFPDGSRYEGEVKDGLPHGQGSTRFKNGIVYTGDWVRGKSHGHGRYIWTDGSYWEGEFRDDKKTDNGKMHFPNKNTRELSGAAPAPTIDPDSETVAASKSIE